MSTNPPEPRTRRASLANAMLGALLCAGIVCAGDAQAQDAPLEPEAAATIERWLLATCVAGEKPELEARLRGQATVLAPAFRTAISSGPPEARISAVRAAAAARFDRRSKFPLEQFRITGVSRDDLQRFERMPRDAFIADEVRRFTLGYRANAVAALGVIGDAASRALLARLADNPDDPLAPAAREALRVQRRD